MTIQLRKRGPVARWLLGAAQVVKAIELRRADHEAQMPEAMLLSGTHLMSDAELEVDDKMASALLVVGEYLTGEIAKAFHK